MVAYAGASNIADAVLLESGAAKGGSMLDPEYILEADPDFIISAASTRWGWAKIPRPPKAPNFDIVNRTGWPEAQGRPKWHSV